jgi:hypothetical protein
MNQHSPDRAFANWPEALRRASALTRPTRSPARFWTGGNMDLLSALQPGARQIPAKSAQGVISTTV